MKKLSAVFNVTAIALTGTMFSSCFLMKEPAEQTQHTSAPTNQFKQLEGGLEYRIVKDSAGNLHPNIGDYLELHLETRVDDSLIFETRSAMEDGKPAPIQMSRPMFKGDLLVGLKELTPGDSAIFKVSVDSALAAGMPEVPWMKKGVGQKMVYNVVLVSVKPMEVKQREEAEHAARQKEIDDKLIRDYLERNNIKAQQTESGLYYTIDREGNGPVPQTGQTVTVNYTGKLLNGDVFDSNVDPRFQHVTPLQFTLGAGQVITGWDEGIGLLKEGTKATLYIPSGLAYGNRSQGPRIAPNSILIFDVELLKNPAETTEK